MIQKNQVTNGHLQKLNMKSDSNLCLETQLHVDSFWWHQALKKSCLKLLELKVPQNLLKKLSISPGNWKHNNLPSLCVFWLSFNLHFSGTNTSTSWATISSNAFVVQGIDWVLWIWETDIIQFPLKCRKKKSEKSEVAWFLRNLNTNPEILDWLLTTGIPYRIFCKTNLQRSKKISSPLPVSCLHWLCCCVDRQVVSGTGTSSSFPATVGWGNRIQRSRDATKWSKSSGKEIYSKKRKKHLQQFAFTSSKFCK